MAVQISITLPDLNGTMEAGLAVGTDPRLAEGDRLPVLITGTIQAAAQHAMNWALGRWRNVDHQAREIYIAGAAAAIFCKLVRRLGTQPDGDWIEAVATTAPTPADLPILNQSCTPESIQRAVTLLVATKANWWLTNHHTGQGEVAGYVRKVLEAQYGRNVQPSIVTAAHTIGHWISTIYVLRTAEIRDLAEIGDALHGGGLQLPPIC